MRKNSFHIFDLFGLPVKLHVSWFIVAVLLSWTLAVGYFPFAVPGLATLSYAWMGFAGTIGLFLSVLLHESGHALMARREGIPMSGITLFIFGGIAEMDSEPPTPRSEFIVAIAGPIVSFALAGVCYAVERMFGLSAGLTGLTAVMAYLAWVNLMVGVFNLVPAFPLDGGRILRAYLWNRRRSLRSATRTSASIGSGFGIMLIVLGVLNVVAGAFVAGMWWGLIGLFLHAASKASYRQVEIRDLLSGESTGRFMNPAPVTVPPEEPVDQFVDEFVYRHHFKTYPVVSHDHLLGCVRVESVKRLPRADWNHHVVQELLTPCTDDGTVSPQTDALETLTKMSRSGNTRLPVVENGRLVGIVSLRDLLGFLSVKLDLEGDARIESEEEVEDLVHVP